MFDSEIEEASATENGNTGPTPNHPGELKRFQLVWAHYRSFFPPEDAGCPFRPPIDRWRNQFFQFKNGGVFSHLFEKLKILQLLSHGRHGLF